MSFTTKARFNSEDPCVIIITLIFLLPTEPNTLAATPLIPRIPEPTTAMTATSSLTSIFLITLPSNDNSKVLVAFWSTSFLTTIEILDSDGLWEIIIMFTLFLAKVSKILPAVPGAPTIPTPLTSIKAVCRIELIALTILWESLLGLLTTNVPSSSIFIKFLILIGMLDSMTGSNALGCIYLAPNSAISNASAYVASRITRASLTIFGSAVINPSTSLHNHTSSAPEPAAIMVAE